jgi:TetR/AcrR family transcriptional regulator
MNSRPSARKTQILEALADMLCQPHAGRITTAALAGHLDLSEAALYRHFENKAAIFEGLIALIESQLAEDLAHINTTEPDGRRQLQKHAHALLLFAQRHPGLAKVLTGHALVLEHSQLQERVNGIQAHIQALLAQSAQAAIAAGSLPGRYSADAYAGVLMNWISGRWLRYVQRGEQALPTAHYSDELALLGL